MSNNGGHNTIQYNLRWSEEMRDKIAAAAKENTRSMNQEIIARLEKSFEHDHFLPKVLEDQLSNTYENLENMKKFVRIIQDLQKTVADQGAMIEKISRENSN